MVNKRVKKENCQPEGKQFRYSISFITDPELVILQLSFSAFQRLDATIQE